MSLRQCPIADICINYKSGDSKPPNHDVRDKIPCKTFLDMTCELTSRVQQEAMGLPPEACKIDKRRKK